MTAKVEISKKILIINSASSALRRIIGITVLVWLHQYLLEQLSSEELKIYGLVVPTMMFIPLLVAVCGSGLRRYAINAYAKGDTERIVTMVSTMAPLLLLTSLTALSLGGLFAWNIGSILTLAPVFVDDAQIMFGLLALMAALRVMLVPFGLGFEIRQKYLARNLIGLGAECLRVLLLWYLLTQVSLQVVWVMVAMITANAIELLVITFMSLRLVPALRFRFGYFQRDQIRPLMSFGGWAVLNQIAFMAREVSDPYILNELGDPAGRDVVAYNTGTLVDRQFRRVYLEAYSAAVPVVTAMDATEQHERLRQTYFRMTRYALWILLSLGMPLIIYSRDFFNLYIRNAVALPIYSTIPTVLALVLARHFFVFPNSILGMVAMAKARVRDLAIRSTIIAIVNTALTIYLVGTVGLGAVGAAFGSFAVTLALNPVLFWTLGLDLTRADLGTWLRVSFLRGILPAACALPVWLGLWFVDTPDRWRWLLIKLAIGSVVYFAAMFFLAMDREDRQDLRKATAKFQKLLPSRKPRK